MAFSPSGKALAAGTDDGRVRLWDVATRRQVATVTTGSTGSTQSVEDVAFSPDDKLLATVAEEGKVRLWKATQDR